MSWSTPGTAVVGLPILASLWNTGARDNLLETAPAKATTAGQLFVATGAGAIAALSVGSALQGLRVNAAGTTVEWGTVPAARVYHNANQAVADNTAVYLAFNSERFDTDAIHDTATNNSRLTCKTAGVYLLTGTFKYTANAAGEYQALLRLNGATIIAADLKQLPAGAIQTGFTIAAIYKLAVNDYVELGVVQVTGGSMTVQSVAAYSPEFAAAWIGVG